MTGGRLLMLAALNGLVATALSALAAHGLTAILDETPLGWVRLAADFWLVHALAMAVSAGAVHAGAGHWAARAGLLFQIGVLAFCLSLVIRAFGWLPPGLTWLTPVGGLSLFAAWSSLALAGRSWHRAPSGAE